jgi:hypothetical protein
MATDEELITRTVHDCFEGWYDADVAWMGRALHRAWANARRPETAARS